MFDDYISHHLDKSWATTRKLSKSLKESEQNAQAASKAAQLAAEDAAKAHAATRETAERATRSLEQAHQATMLAQQAHQKALSELNHAYARAEQAEQQKIDADAHIAALQEALAASQLSGHHLTVWAHDLEARLNATHASTSWKVTAPLRAVGRVVHALRRPGLARRVVTRVTKNERMRRLLIPVLLRYPALGKKVSTSLAAIKQAAPEPVADAAAVAVPEELKGLPVSVRAVLGDLQRARGGQAGH